MTQTSTTLNESIKLITPSEKEGRSTVVSFDKGIAPMWHEQKPNQFDSNYKEGGG